MKLTLILSAAICALSFQPQAHAQQELQEKLAIVKEGVAKNQAALRQYTWTEQTNVLRKGEVKKTTYYQCQYGPDGTVQKMPTGGSRMPSGPRGIRGRGSRTLGGPGWAFTKNSSWTACRHPTESESR